MSAECETPERWNSRRLAELIAGTNREWWKRKMIPELVASGVLKPHGRGWFGQRSAITAALMAAR